MTANSIHSSSAPAAPADPRQVLTSETLTQLNQRSDRAGALRLVGHLLTLLLSGGLWAFAPVWLAIPALFVYGTGLALMFCAMHECVHRTAFSRVKANDAVAWFAGLLSFYNATFYRRYHKRHHRYTQIPGKDPELDDPKPETLAQYLWQLSGLPWWWGKLVAHTQMALGHVEQFPFLSETAQAEVVRSVRSQLAVYGAIALVSALLGHPGLIVTHWLLPLAVGQPVLRYVLLAEHGGCTQDDNPLTNTRTTLTLGPLRFLMWNMPYHAEHHLYPSIPFHALPAAHRSLSPQFAQVAPGYLSVHRGILAAFE
ncbi:MAG: fatty acid desaturase [Leptolyngbya sp. SIO4C1]|nr:fatty acid desaturase [Leptolyngbya sp. SIO4C1]